MVQNLVQHEDNKPKNVPDEITKFKEDDLAPKGHTKHIVETDWPTQESIPEKPKKRKEIKKTQTARLP